MITLINKYKKQIKEFGLTIIYAVFFAAIFRSFVYDPFHIPSGSMMPNLIEGDKIIVNKYRYGYSKYSLPIFAIPIKGRFFNFKKPQRGDIAVFVLPSDNQTYYVKRIIGLPGDSITIKNDLVFVNHKPQYQIFEGMGKDADLPQSMISKYSETNIDKKRYYIYRSAIEKQKPNVIEYQVPENQYFMMGDNRDNSLDSRYAQVGFIPYENIVGRVEYVFFSSSHSPLVSIFTPWTIRLDRFFLKTTPTS